MSGLVVLYVDDTGVIAVDDPTVIAAPVDREVRLEVMPITISSASKWCDILHRHHEPSPGALFAVAVTWKSDPGVRTHPIGVALVGRPVARMLNDGRTVEITRVATDGTRNACSMLYGAARRAAFALGYRRIVTYTLAEEGGASLRASGFRVAAETAGGAWDRPRRKRSKSDTEGPKIRWECAA